MRTSAASRSAARPEPAPPPAPSLSWVPTVASGALGMWLGVHAIRMLGAMVAWNAAEDMPAHMIGLVAISVYAVGLIAWLPARFAGGPRPAWRFGVLLAGLTVARQAFPGEISSPALAFAAGIAWLWWLPAFLQEMARCGLNRWIVPAIVLGLAGQSAGQAAMHGMDLYMFRGLLPVFGAAALAGAFVAANWWAGRSRPVRPANGSANAEAGAAWGALALGPYLFLQFTLFANMGRVAIVGNWDAFTSACVIQASTLAGLAVLLWQKPPQQQLLPGLVAAFLLIPGVFPAYPWKLILAQAFLTPSLAAAFAPSDRKPKGRVYLTTAIGALILYLLWFVYYFNYGWLILWPVTAAAVVLIGLKDHRVEPMPSIRPILVGAVVAAIGIGVSLVPASGAKPAAGPAPADLKVLSYNIHQGLDAWSAPAIQKLAGVIAASKADVIGLQEVNRGMNLSAGVDTVSYLRWRFPEYYVATGKIQGDLWVNVIMSRYPIQEAGDSLFPKGAYDFPRGYNWALVPTVKGDLLFANAHYNGYHGDDAERLEQSVALLDFWKSRPHLVMLGDFNAWPDSETILRFEKSGLTESLAALGTREIFTYSADKPFERLDYIFTTADIETVSANVGTSTASDHLPVEADLRLK